MVLPGSNQVLSASLINQELLRSSSNTFSTNDIFFREFLASNGSSQPVSWSELRGRTFTVFTINTDTANFNIKAQLQAAGWSNTNQAVAFINVASNAVVYSTNTILGAIESDSGYTSTSRVKIHIEPGAYVVGMGGAGGAGSDLAVNDKNTQNYGGPGMHGGPAIVTEIPTTLVNQGIIGGGGGGGSGSGNEYTNPPPCMIGDTLITMHDGSKKQIMDIVAGDRVKTLTGKGGFVTGKSITKLGFHRRLINMLGQDPNNPLVIADNHDFWIKREDGTEKFGVYNYNGWLELELALEDSKSDGDKALIYDMEVLLPNKEYNFAVDFGDGWLKTKCHWEMYASPHTELHQLEIDEGVGYIANDFVVAADDWLDSELDKLRWKHKK